METTLSKLFKISTVQELVGDRFAYVVAGPGGTGKSTLLGSMAKKHKTLLLATLPREAASWLYRELNIDTIPLWEDGWYTTKEDGTLPEGIIVKAFGDFLRVTEALRDDDTYDAVVLDNGTEMAELAWHQAMLTHGVIAPAYITDKRSRWLPYETLSTNLDQAIKNLVSLTGSQRARRPKFVGIAWHCFSSDTEVLARERYSDESSAPLWINGEQLTKEHEVAAWNPSDGTLQWERPTGIYKYTEGFPTLLTVEQRNGVNFAVTPEHGVWWRKPTTVGPRDTMEKTWQPYARVTAAEASQAQSERRVPRVAELRGLSGTSLSSAQLRLLGYIQTEGWFEGRWGIRVGQSVSSPVCNHIRAALQGSGVEFTEHVEKRKGRVVGINPTSTANDDMLRFYIRAKSAAYFRGLLSRGKLRVPAIIWNFATRVEVLDYFDACREGDGTARSDESFRLYTASRDLANDWQALAVSRGIAASISKSKELYSVGVNVERREATVVPDDWHSVSNTYPFVWCLSVPSGAVLVRRNGRTCILSNTQPPKEDQVEIVGEGSGSAKVQKASADNKGEGVEYEGKVLPMIRGGFRRKLSSQVDAFIYTDILYTTSTQGTRVVKTPRYVLQIQPDEERHAKIPGPMSLVKYIDNDFEALYKAVKEGRVAAPAVQSNGGGALPHPARPSSLRKEK